jgi:hypothetical protein
MPALLVFLRITRLAILTTNQQKRVENGFIIRCVWCCIVGEPRQISSEHLLNHHEHHQAFVEDGV